MEVESALPTNNLAHQSEPADVDEENVTAEHHQALVSNLNRCSGSAMYTFGDNIVQCSLFGPNPMSSNLNLLKKNYFNVYLYPLGKIKNLTKGMFFCNLQKIVIHSSTLFQINRSLTTSISSSAHLDRWCSTPYYLDHVPTWC